MQKSLEWVYYWIDGAREIRKRGTEVKPKKEGKEVALLG